MNWSRLAWGIFDVVFRPFMRGRIRVYEITKLRDYEITRLRGRPVVLVANHCSWWDGFLLREVQRRYFPKAVFHTVMLESELAKFPFLSMLGAIPLMPSSVSSLRAMLRKIKRLSMGRHQLVLSYFPQGKISPSWDTIFFRRGILGVMEAFDDCVVLPVGLHIEPLTTVRPTAFISVGRPLENPDVRSLEMAVTEELRAIRDHIRDYGELAAHYSHKPVDSASPDTGKVDTTRLASNSGTKRRNEFA